MRIEDAIKRYESWAEDDRIDVLIRKEHRQIADWLKELKADIPQGEWMDAKSAGWKCTVCGKWSNGQYDYCPYCGARMKGADDE